MFGNTTNGVVRSLNVHVSAAMALGNYQIEQQQQQQQRQPSISWKECID